MLQFTQQYNNKLIRLVDCILKCPHCNWELPGNSKTIPYRYRKNSHVQVFLERNDTKITENNLGVATENVFFYDFFCAS